MAANDKQLIAKILHTHEAFTVLPEVHRIVKTLAERPYQTHSQIYNGMWAIIEANYRSMHFIVNAIPDFRVLTSVEQCSLIDRNLHGLVCFHMICSLREAVQSNNIFTLKLFGMIYGERMFMIIQLIHRYSHLDCVFHKLLLIALAFSANCFKVESVQDSPHDGLLLGTHRLLGSQNVYVELMWKHLFSEYGYYKSVKYLGQMLGFVLAIMAYSMEAYMKNQTYHVLVNKLAKTIKVFLLRNQNESAPLWGKL